MRDLAGYVADDELARAPLRELGWEVDSVPWDRSGVAWGDYEVVVIRSTWDYHRRPGVFLARLAEIERSGVRLENSLATVRWNTEKTYLRDLAERGVATVPTIYRPRLAAGELAGLFDEIGRDEMVVKPVIGASAVGAYRLDRSRVRERAAEVEAFYADRALMAQPLVRAVLDEGEHSLVYFEGAFSHAVIKTPATGDFRTQEEHGAVLRATDADADLREAGAAALATLGELPLYARADFVWADEGVAPWLMELELIEPSLYLRMDVGAPERFAAAIHARSSRGTTSRG